MSDLMIICKACLKIAKGFIPALLILTPIAFLFIQELRREKAIARHRKNMEYEYKVIQEAERVQRDYPHLYYVESIELAKAIIDYEEEVNKIGS